MRQLAIEIISGEVPDFGHNKVLDMIKNYNGAKMGRVSVSFGSPIDLKAWLKD